MVMVGVLLVGPVSFAGPVSAEEGRADVTCLGETATIVGTPGDEVLRGTSGRDVIVGLRGDDVIYGGGGADLICAGRGADVVYGGAGNDRVYGGAGDDWLYGGAGNDWLYGNGGDDGLTGGGGFDPTDGGRNGFGPGDICDGETQVSCEGEFNICQPSSPPAGLVQGFYGRYCEVLGLPLLSSDAVPEAALQAAATIIRAMLTDRADIVGAIAEADTVDEEGHRFGVMGRNEVTTDLPEYSDLYEWFPETDWDRRVRGLGGTFEYPLTSGAEENLLCLPWGTIEPWGGGSPYGDPYFGESVLVHEVAHTIHLFGLGNIEYAGVGAGVDPTFDGRLEATYEGAIAAGRWAGTYAATNYIEYWAVGVSAYFNTNGSTDPATNRTELEAYDLPLFDLIEEVFGGLKWQPDCTSVWSSLRERVAGSADLFTWLFGGDSLYTPSPHIRDSGPVPGPNPLSPPLRISL
ncbi:MAG: hypothetical protein A2Z12_09485 [Actinobacteria bacterium RBG_16_68_21]|nr:MAG: hypothetical protein A2Z12_09485 [Actinobacteria bacterium RBG_16_68_21]